MIRYFQVIFFAGILALLISCHQEQNEALYAPLQLWDSLLEENPEAVRDSLSQLNYADLSRANRAYYGLLKTIADDKTYADFTSDSLMNAVTDYYSHSKEHKNYVRALTYQGIVRVRMGDADSTAYIPFKAAIDRITRQKKIDTTALYFANYYLAYLNGGHRNFSIAHKYYIEALNCIRLRKDTTRLFDVYYSLYWNYLKQEENEKAYPYLDSLNSCCRTPQEKYYLLSAQSVFYDLNGNDKEALQAEKEQLQFLPQLKEKPEYFRIYYSISDQYHRLNQLDSAMFYAQKAIEHIQDSTYKLNYIFYENIGEIAEAQHNYQLASSYRKKALDIYNQSIEKQKDTHILELEKRYDLSKAENKTLRAEKRNRLYVIIMLLFISLIAFLLFYFYKQRAIGLLRKKEAEEKARRLQTEKTLLQQQSAQQDRMLAIFGNFLTQYGLLHDQARTMVNKVRATDRQLGDDYETMLHQRQQHFNELSNRFFTAEEIEKQFGICYSSDVFSQSERMLLFMLAAQTPNQQIAALLNTNTYNLKTRKSHLKKKIEDEATSENYFARLLPLFSAKSDAKKG